ncbi:MAG: hypothetical protein HY080_02960 [Gammaproteobacteria bacterium]|nr:hypothetical protein [Gammaproteobacteria bacterium]
MKHVLQLASAMLAGCLAGQSFALTPPTPTSAGTTANFTLYTSGSSALQKNIKAMFTSYCQTGTLDIFQDQPWNGAAQSGTTLGAAWQAYFCTFKTGAPVTNVSLQGKKVLVINRAKGGSVWGVVPVQKNMLVEEMNIFRNGSGRDCTSAGTDAQTGAPLWNCPVEIDASTNAAARRAVGTGLDTTLNSWECNVAAAPLVSNEIASGVTTDTLCRSSHEGVSDVEPGMFAGSPNRPAFPTAANNIPNLALTAKPGFGVVFGVSVGDDVYDQLQTTQNLIAADGVTRCDALATRDRAIDSPCQPSLSKAEVTAIFSGTITNWSGLGMPTLSGGFGDMAICRRVVGSGTQAGANAYFLENPCRTGANGGKRDFVTAAATNGAGYTVVEGFGSGNVIACHNSAFAGDTSATTGAPGIVGVTGSIGIQGLEKLPGATDHWHYVRINGVAPTIANYLNGKYDYAFENTLQFNSTLSTTSLEYALATELQTQAVTPTFLKTANVQGVAALCSATQPSNPGTATTAPVTRMVRGGNSCNAATLCP